MALCIQGFCPASGSSLAQPTGLPSWDALSRTCISFPRKLNSVSYIPWSGHVHGFDGWKNLTDLKNHPLLLPPAPPAMHLPQMHTNQWKQAHICQGSWIPHTQLLAAFPKKTRPTIASNFPSSLFFPASSCSYFPPHEAAEAPASLTPEPA